MARISREERLKKKNALDDAIWNVFAKEGWDAITYQRLADEIGTSRSTIQRYYPTQLNFLEAIEGKVFPQFTHSLNTECPDKFIESWQKQMCEPLFRNSFQLAANDALNGLDGKHGKGAIANLRSFIQKHFGSENSERILWQAVGSLIVRFAEDAPTNG